MGFLLFRSRKSESWTKWYLTICGNSIDGGKLKEAATDKADDKH
jgi:hypothetical protein